MKKERKISVTQIVTYIITLAIIAYILFSVISTSLAGRITKLQNDVYSKNSTTYQTTKDANEKNQARNNLLTMTASVEGKKLNDQATVALNNPFVVAVNKPVTLQNGKGDSATYNVNFELQFFAYSTSDNFDKPAGYIGFVSNNTSDFQKSDSVLTLSVKQPGQQPLNLVLSSQALDSKTKQPTGTKSVFGQTFLLPSADLNSIVVQANVSSANANSEVPVLYLASNKNLATVYNSENVVTNYELNTKLQAIKAGSNDKIKLDTKKYSLSNYNGSVALNTVLVIIVSLVIVYIFFIHKYVKAAIAKKKQQKKEANAATDEEVQEADFVEEETENKEDK